MIEIRSMFSLHMRKYINGKLLFTFLCVFARLLYLLIAYEVTTHDSSLFYDFLSLSSHRYIYHRITCRLRILTFRKCCSNNKVCFFFFSRKNISKWQENSLKTFHILILVFTSSVVCWTMMKSFSLQPCL